jgi:hypothetical protein
VHRRHRRLLLGRWSVLTFVAFIVTQPDPTKTHETLLPQAEHLVLGPKAAQPTGSEKEDLFVNSRLNSCIIALSAAFAILGLDQQTKHWALLSLGA